jgi:Mg/Co/Ni transporter MgtE
MSAPLTVTADKTLEETLVAIIAIAVFLPMVSGMSGGSDNQAVGVCMRELVLGLARPLNCLAFKTFSLHPVIIGPCYPFP